MSGTLHGWYQSAENQGKECYGYWLRLRQVVILILNIKIPLSFCKSKLDSVSLNSNHLDYGIQKDR